jgi:hypothetical protein
VHNSTQQQPIGMEQQAAKQPLGPACNMEAACLSQKVVGLLKRSYRRVAKHPSEAAHWPQDMSWHKRSAFAAQEVLISAKCQRSAPQLGALVVKF